MRYQALFPIVPLLASALLVMQSAAAGADKPPSAATLRDLTPPPGLYRVDMEGTMQRTGPDRTITRVMSSDGATGDETDTFVGTGVSHRYAGQGPATVCVPKANSVNILAGKGGCQVPPPTMVNGALQWSYHCAGMDVVETTRRTGPTTWQHVERSTLVSPPTATPAEMGPYLVVLEYAAQHAATQEERAKAREQLATMKEMARRQPTVGAPPVIPELQTAQARAAAQAGGSNQIFSIVNWTRIADTCKP